MTMRDLFHLLLCISRYACLRACGTVQALRPALLNSRKPYLYQFGCHQILAVITTNNCEFSAQNPLFSRAIQRRAHSPTWVDEEFTIGAQGLQHAQRADPLHCRFWRCAHQFGSLRQVGQDDVVESRVGFLAEFAIFRNVGQILVDDGSELLIVAAAEAVIPDVRLARCHCMADGIHVVLQYRVGFPFNNLLGASFWRALRGRVLIGVCCAR